MKWMTVETFKELVRICRRYDPFTHYIEDYRQMEKAQERNEMLEEKFNDLMQDVWQGYDMGIPWAAENARDTDEVLEKWLCENSIEVNRNSGVPGGRYWEPGEEEANDNVDWVEELGLTGGDELPFM